MDTDCLVVYTVNKEGACESTCSLSYHILDEVAQGEAAEQKVNEGNLAAGTSVNSMYMGKDTPVLLTAGLI